jgi:hypothetical protein
MLPVLYVPSRKLRETKRLVSEILRESSLTWASIFGLLIVIRLRRFGMNYVVQRAHYILIRTPNEHRLLLTAHTALIIHPIYWYVPEFVSVG